MLVGVVDRKDRQSHLLFRRNTGYCGEVFKMTGDLYPVDLSAIPIAAYGVPDDGSTSQTT